MEKSVQLSHQTLNNLGLVLVASAAIVLRFYKVDQRGLWFDEIESWYSALSGQISSLDAPLNRMTYRLFFHLTGHSDTYFLHLLPILFGLLSLVVFWKFIQLPIFNQSTSYRLGCFAMVSLSPFLTYFSQEARPYSLQILFIFLSFHFFLRGNEKHQNRDWILFALSLAGSLSTHLTSLAAVAGFGSFAFWSIFFETTENMTLKKRIMTQLKLLFSICFGLVIGLFWLLIPEAKRVSPDSLPSGIYGQGFLHFFQTYFNQMAGSVAYFPVNWASMTASILLSVVFFLGLYSFWKQRKFQLFFPFTVTILCNLVLLYGTLGPVMSKWAWVRYTSPSILAALVCLAEGFSYLHTLQRHTARFALFCYCLFLAFGINYYIQNYTFDRSHDFREMINITHQNENRIEGIIFVTEHEGYRDYSHYLILRKDQLPIYHFREDSGFKKIEIVNSSVRNFQYPVLGESDPVLKPGGYILIFDKNTSCKKIPIPGDKALLNTGKVYEGDRFALAGCLLEAG